MTVFAIMAATAENRVAKLREFETAAEAEAHVERFTGAYPDAFVHVGVAAPLSHWLIDMAAKTVTIDVPPPAPAEQESRERRAIRALAASLGSEAVAAVESELGARR